MYKFDLVSDIGMTLQVRLSP